MDNKVIQNAKVIKKVKKWCQSTISKNVTVHREMWDCVQHFSISDVLLLDLNVKDCRTNNKNVLFGEGQWPPKELLERRRFIQPGFSICVSLTWSYKWRCIFEYLTQLAFNVWPWQLPQRLNSFLCSQKRRTWAFTSTSCQSRTYSSIAEEQKPQPWQEGQEEEVLEDQSVRGPC